MAQLLTLGALALAAAACIAAFDGDLRTAAFAAGAFVTIAIGSGAMLVALVVCVAAGEWVVAACQLATLAGARSGSLSAALAPSRVDRIALAEAFGALPAGLRADLRWAAGDAPVSTRHMVEVAASKEPAMWSSLLGDDPGNDAWDGPVQQPGGMFTQYSAEAAALARELVADLGRPVDAQILAVAAGAVALSAGEAWVTDMTAPAELIAGLSAGTFTKRVGAFAGTPVGTDVARRIDAAVKTGPMLRGFLSREELAALDRRTMVVLRVRLAADVAADIVKDIASGVVVRRRVPPDARPAHSVIAPAPRPRNRQAPRALHALVKFAPALRRAVETALIVAIPASVASVGWPGVLVIAGAALVKPLRRGWMHIALGTVTAPLSAVAAGLILLRGAFAESRILLAGRTAEGNGNVRQRGVEKRVAQRRQLTVGFVDEAPPDLEAAKTQLSTALSKDDDNETGDRSIAVVLAAWAESRPVELTRAITLLLRGALFGQWSTGAGHTSLDAELRRRLMIEVTSTFAVRASAVISAGLVAGFALPRPDDLSPPLGLAAGVALGLAAGLVAVALTARRPGCGSVLMAGVASALLAGTAAGSAAGIGLAAGLVGHGGRRFVSRMAVSGRERWREWPAPTGPRRLRLKWQTAEEAVGEHRVGVGITMLRELANEAQAPDRMRLAAIARLALLDLERGRVDATATALDSIVPGLVDRPASAPEAAVMAGVALSGLADLGRAQVLLVGGSGALPNRSPLRVTASLALADVFARSGQPEQAIQHARALRSRLISLQGFDHLIDTEVVIAAALARRGDLAGGLDRLDDALLFDVVRDPSVGALDPRIVVRVERAAARAHLLAGRLELARNRASAAQRHLSVAVAALSEQKGTHLSAVARVLHGVALVRTLSFDTGVAALGEGLAELESRRTQLRASDRRSAMIASDAEIYACALDALVAADRRRGTRAAGRIAVTLVESLRRSAIASSLRAGSLPLNSEARKLADRIAALERRTGDDVAPESRPAVGGDDDDELRAIRSKLSKAISARFAASYLPQPVNFEDVAKSVAGHDHVLLFFVLPGGVTGWRAWLTSEGAARIDAVRLIDPAARAMVESLDNGEETMTGPAIHRPMRFDSTQVWDQLATELLPEELRDLLAATPAGTGDPLRILVVPDGPLALVPWAALHVAGEPLVSRAVLQIVPSLDLLATAAPAARTQGRRVLAHLDSALDGYAHEQRQLSEGLAVDFATTRDEFVTALDTGRHAGAYIATHGHGLGIEQRVFFADGAALSAASALRHEWPEWTLFASCLVGRVESVAGREPFGLPISCLLGGGRSVLASVVDIRSSNASAVCSTLGIALAAGDTPADALRAAQLAFLGRNDLATVADCLGLVCISTSARPDVRNRNRVSSTLVQD